MAKCKECGKESDNYRLCTDCKKDWKRKRLKAYEIVESEIGKQTYQNRKEFTNSLNEVERGDCKHEYRTFGLKESERERWCIKCFKTYQFAR